MPDNITIIPFRQTGSTIDPLTPIARDGARRMLMACQLQLEKSHFMINNPGQCGRDLVTLRSGGESPGTRNRDEDARQIARDLSCIEIFVISRHKRKKEVEMLFVKESSRAEIRDHIYY